jgi:hypothetical protein
MEPLIAVYDACVLYPNFLRDFLVRLAIHGRRQGLLRAKWTGRIHREWIRAILRNKPELRPKLVRTRRLMDQAVLGCRVHGYERWERRLTLPDENDRHVLAAALVCAADVIVTFDLAHFPAEVLRPFGVAAVKPDDFVLPLMDMGIVASTAADHRAALKNPPMSPTEYLDALDRNRLTNTAKVLAACPI